MKILKNFVKYGISFTMGVVLTLAVIRIFVLPDLAMDISKLSLEAAMRSYAIGVEDATENTQTFYDYFNEEEIMEVNNWEYRFITE